MIKNDIFQMTCTSLGSNMEGICHQDGMVVFVPGMLPGETSPVRIVKTQANYAFGILDGAPISPSDTRIFRTVQLIQSAVAVLPVICPTRQP